MTNPIYERILEELAAGELNEIEQQVFQALRKAYPAARTRHWLIYDVYGYLPAEDEALNNNKHDRKIRKALASLFEKGIPVISTSAEAGYRLDVSEESLQGMIAELRSRRAKLDEKIESAEKTKLKVRQFGVDIIPTKLPEERKPMQLGMFEYDQ